MIDEDQGKSGASAQGRDGFARVVDAVVKGEAGAILAVEVSRLSRSSEDWRRLLGLCGIAGVAVIDEQAIYDPSDPDDKLLLDLKGTMSEAELHWLGLRLMGARRQKARRGELEIHPPTGYVWHDGGLALDPDEAVVRAIRVLFDRFRVEPSVCALLRWANEQRVQMPTRQTYADGTTEVMWKPVRASRLYWMLHNPIYAGAYAYGRCTKVEKIVDGNIRRAMQREHDPSKWLVVKQDAHAGYITWSTAAKYGHQAELEAERLEQQAEGETFATNLSLMMAREYWLAAADWRSREQGVNSPAVQNARLRAAETYAKEADKAHAANQPGAEALFLGNAITALRRAGADRARTEALLNRMLTAQRTAPRAGISTSVNLTDLVVDGRKAVEGKTLKDALLGLAMVASSPAVSTLREMTSDYPSKSLVGRLFPVILSSSDSRVVAHMPALSSLGDDSTEERVLRWHMWQQAQWIRMMSCSRIVGAREQIELEHNPCLADLIPLMNASALVPAGHEGLFAKGIHAGLRGDFVVAIHILIPQLENGLRSFVQDVLERPIVSHDDDGTQSVNLLRRILTHPDLAKVLGEDLLFDLQGLLIMQEATNLRNILSHGLLADRSIGLDAIYAWWICLRICVMLTPIKHSETGENSVVFAAAAINEASGMMPDGEQSEDQRRSDSEVIQDAESSDV